MELVEQAPDQKMLFARNNIHNRFMDRARAKEAEKIIPVLLSVEDMFTKHLQQESLKFTYDQVFNHFNKQYVEAATHCVKKYKPKHVLINPKYFEDKYKSKEN